MNDTIIAPLLYYFTVTFNVALPCLGVAIGQSLAGKEAVAAINRQPAARVEIMRTVILGMALTETATLIGITLSIILLADHSLALDMFYPNLARLGIFFAIALTGLTIGLVSAAPIKQACHALARQPFFGQKIFNLLLISQSLLQTPLVFGFIIAYLIKMQSVHTQTLADSARLLASGFAIGIGSIGPIIGLAIFARSALRGLGINRKAYLKLMTFTFISEAIVETPILFSFVIALLLLFTPLSTTYHAATPIIMMSAALCMGIGTLLPSIKSGHIAAAAVLEIARKPENYTLLSRVSMLAQALVDTFVIYAALVSLLIILIR